MNATAQITLIHTYDSAASVSINGNVSQLMIINFEVSGEKYVNINRWGKYISIYDMNHSLIKTISLIDLPLNTSGQVGDILYISEQLFDTDTGIEFMYCYNSTTTNYTTQIYNDDGSFMFSENGAPLVKVNYPLQQYPVYNTSQGTIMILSYENGQAKVFSLPGTLSENIAKANIDLVAQNSISNPYPNPAVNTTQVDYELPKGINHGEIVFYNLQGKEVKRFQVDKTFNTLLISTSDLSAGTYYYQLQTTGQNSEGKKMVVLK